MRLLLDTHILIWAVAVAGDPGPNARMRRAAALIDDGDNSLHFSVTSIWEVAIKSSLSRPDFPYDAQQLRSALLGSGYSEVSINGDHAVQAGRLPLIHRDPFDRILLAQAMVDDMSLVTTDAALGRYPGPILRI